MTLNLSLDRLCRPNSLFAFFLLFGASCTLRRRRDHDEQKALVLV